MNRRVFDYVATIQEVQSTEVEQYPISVLWSPNTGWDDHLSSVANAAAAQRTVETRKKFRGITAEAA